jgi:hypothetical protein
MHLGTAVLLHSQPGYSTYASSAVLYALFVNVYGAARDDGDAGHQHAR